MEFQLIASILIVLVGVISLTDGLYCYQCAAVKKEGLCASGYQDIFLETRKKVLETNDTIVGDRYLGNYKKCDFQSNRNVCMIETVRRGDTDTLLSYTRDCSDGKTFSFEMDALKNLPADNYTTCAYYPQGYQVCITLCNEDFCNGPNSAPSLRYAVVPLLLMQVCLYFMQ